MITPPTRRVDVSLRLAKMQEESKLYLVWYNQLRPHQTLNGRTPDEVFFDREPVNEEPRWEPRKGWPRKTVCAAPWAEVEGRRGAKAELRVSFLEGRKRLPVIELTRAA